ncbi:MAG: MucB/RseB C-terminal domain-containing protein, partial [Stenotrophobium sp.]
MRLPVFAGAFALAVAPAVFADEPADWLVKMSDAAHAATYQGIVVYRGDHMLDTFRVTHRAINGAETERVQSLNGEMRDILKIGNKLICLLPRDRRVAVNPPTPKALFPSLTVERLKQIAQIYSLDSIGNERVAGRICRGIAITPRDEYRYGYEIWADGQNAVPLKVNLVGRDGSTLEQMMFTEVDFPAGIPDSAFQLPPEDSHYKRITRDLPPANAVPSVAAVAPAPDNNSVEWTLAHLPPGFQVVMRSVHELPDNGGTVEHLLVSDGLSAVSVFTAQRPATAKPLNGMSQIGA